MKNIEAMEIANRIRTADTWNEEDLAALCDLAGLGEKYATADGDEFESVVYEAAAILGVEIF